MSVKSGAIETSKEVLIKNSLGLHARAAAQLVKTAELYNSDVWLEKNGKSVDAKSVISLLTLECPPGSKVIIKARGQDSQIAIEAISKLIEDDFGE
ncbi:MAG: HPr family phosphocarrier protein [Deltaproteobacteria bacterium]|nr:HPr family phosphocarrier protein [Deltaproteobacteria bacterium]MBW2141212.1 HPr family phosphocarrier protein [Deltaproteobacteria bacterium]MBW2323074.1 HPr family phosphocarrier protein [Deltaproteobacteria bacterium]